MNRRAATEDLKPCPGGRRFGCADGRDGIATRETDTLDHAVTGTPTTAQEQPIQP